ncbi:MAG TPA: error-prone DNA polymerase, partial [Acidobacteria bacterium]|nr:error-prone DNA polymerase [Acidobacteriota bacterium]
VFDQIRGFGEYGFPESHAASFALIAYATSWIRCHYPDVFTCSLLNAQPMGFYSPATIVDDAKRHGVEIHPVDIAHSDWHCTLEPRDPHPTPFAVRMGLRYVKGLSHARDWTRIDAARREAPFDSIDDLVSRTTLNERTLSRLAEAGALTGLQPHRREALWQVRGLARTPTSALLGKPTPDATPVFAKLGVGDSIAWDYRASGHSSRGHPLAAIRAELTAQGLPDARAISVMRDRRKARYAGLVICRQRPGTAAGVVFMTLEDETGFVNLVIWKTVFDQHVLIAKTASFLGVTGKIQNADGVVHLVVDTLWHPELPQRPDTVGSRDFH